MVQLVQGLRKCGSLLVQVQCNGIEQVPFQIPFSFKGIFYQLIPKPVNESDDVQDH